VFVLDLSLEKIRRISEVTEPTWCNDLDRLPIFILAESPEIKRSRVLPRLKFLFGPTVKCIPLRASSNCDIKKSKFSTYIKHTSYNIRVYMVGKWSTHCRLLHMALCL